jgi:hypothetical protein
VVNLYARFRLFLGRRGLLRKPPEAACYRRE